MQAVVIREPGDEDVLSISRRPSLEPTGRQVRIRVAAAGVNRADLIQRVGRYPAPDGAPADIPGLEFAGTIDAVGAEVDHARIGERVMGIVAGGAMATELITDERLLAPIPREMSFADAAAIPEVFITAYDALVHRGRLAAGERVLIRAAGSGVGTAAIQIARALGATAFGSSRSRWKLERAAEFGLEGSWVAGEEEIDADLAADVLINPVGGATIAEDVTLAARGGRIVLLGLLAGARCDLSLATMLRKRLELVGTVLRSRTLEEKAVLTRELATKLVPRFEAKELRPVVDRVMPMSQVGEAHRLLAKSAVFGKVILEW